MQVQTLPKFHVGKTTEQTSLLGATLLECDLPLIVSVDHCLHLLETKPTAAVLFLRNSAVSNWFLVKFFSTAEPRLLHHGSLWKGVPGATKG